MRPIYIRIIACKPIARVTDPGFKSSLAESKSTFNYFALLTGMKDKSKLAKLMKHLLPCIVTRRKLFVPFTTL
jgi:hypothetical protein